MSKYPIVRWDAIITGDVNDKSPMIYIKPDADFLEFAEANSFEVFVEIQGTGLCFDGATISGTVKKSCNSPNARPNFFSRTEYYVVVLRTPWSGYPHPKSLGTAVFKGLRTITDVAVASVDHDDHSEMIGVGKPYAELKSGGDKKDSLDKWQIIGLVVFLLLLLVGLLCMNRYGTKSNRAELGPLGPPGPAGPHRIFY
jgi:hypothetical protein